jgi:hypothetical protein
MARILTDLNQQVRGKTDGKMISSRGMNQIKKPLLSGSGF